MKANKIYDLMKKITKESKNAEHYETGLVGEQMIVASYKTMPLDKLEKMRFIINKIIKQKKEFIRFANAQKNGDNKKEVPMMVGESEKEQ